MAMQLQLGSPEAQRLLAESHARHVSSLGTFRVLLVEDDSLQRLQIAALFDAANRKNNGAVKFELTMAESAAEAVSKLAAAPTLYNLVLLDLLLPDQNGFDVLPALRREVDDDVAIVIVSAFPELSLVQLCVRRGADAFLAKPLNVNDVRHCWQFVKEQALPEGSFKADLESLHPSAAAAHFGMRTSMAAEEASTAPRQAVCAPCYADDTFSASFSQGVVVDGYSPPNAPPLFPPGGASLDPYGCGVPRSHSRAPGCGALGGVPRTASPGGSSLGLGRTDTNASQGSVGRSDTNVSVGSGMSDYYDAREHPLGVSPNNDDETVADCRTT